MDGAGGVSARPPEAPPEEAAPAVGDPKATGEPTRAGVTSAVADPKAIGEAVMAGMTAAAAGVTPLAEDRPIKHAAKWVKLIMRADLQRAQVGFRKILRRAWGPNSVPSEWLQGHG